MDKRQLTRETPADRKRHDLLLDVSECVAHHMVEKHGLDAEQAAAVGNEAADFLMQKWRGQSIYIVGDKQFQLRDRDREIFERFRRGNADELGAEFGISGMRVYQICARYRARLAADRLNATDKDKSGKPLGERITAQLSPEDIATRDAAVGEALERGENKEEIATRFGLSISTLSSIHRKWQLDQAQANKNVLAKAWH